MEIIRLDKSVYEGKKFTARYKTSGYYDIRAFNDGFKIEYLRLKEPIEKSFEEEFFGKWLENPTAYGAFEGKKLLGYAEGSIESWNNRFRISNICVFENSERRRGIGTALIEKISKTAKSLKARMIVLETQSCNENAIAFYKKHGFEIIGFDLFSYTNDDPIRHEIRIEMGKKL